jgi:hypothetical protein
MSAVSLNSAPKRLGRLSSLLALNVLHPWPQRRVTVIEPMA